MNLSSKVARSFGRLNLYVRWWSGEILIRMNILYQTQYNSFQLIHCTDLSVDWNFWPQFIVGWDVLMVLHLNLIMMCCQIHDNINILHQLFIISSSILVEQTEWSMSLSPVLWCLHTTSLFSALVDPFGKLSMLPPTNDSAVKLLTIIFTCFSFEPIKLFALLMVSQRPSVVIFNVSNVVLHLARWPCSCNVYESEPPMI